MNEVSLDLILSLKNHTEVFVMMLRGFTNLELRSESLPSSQRTRGASCGGTKGATSLGASQGINVLLIPKKIHNFSLAPH